MIARLTRRGRYAAMLGTVLATGAAALLVSVLCLLVTAPR